MAQAMRTAIVTGSTSGIGLGIAQVLAGKGYQLMFNGFGDPAEIDTLVRDTEKHYSVRTAYSRADMSKPDEVAAMVEDAVKKLGSVDVLVNNAGIQFTAPLTEFPPEKWEQILSINLSAAFYAMRAALPHMQKRKWGRVINIASAHGLVASPNKAAYVAAKHGLVGLTKVAALENARNGITVNAICPGWVHTPLVQKQIEDNAAKQQISVEKATEALLEGKEPSMQFSTPEHLGELVAFLCSDAGANMTGTSLSHDGGWTAI